MVELIEDVDKSSKKKKDDEEYDSALDFLGLDKKEVEDEAFVNFKMDKEVANKVTKLRQFAISFRMTLEGKTYDEEKGGFKQKSKSIAGSRFIEKSSGLLMAYATEANLLTQKDMETFVIQFADACRKVETELLRDRTISEKDTRVIFKMFKDNLFNIGEVITGSKDNMKSVFGKLDQERKEQNEGLGF